MGKEMFVWKGESIMLLEAVAAVIKAAASCQLCSSSPGLWGSHIQQRGTLSDVGMQAKIWGRNTKIRLHQTLLRETVEKSTLIRPFGCISYTVLPRGDAKKQPPKRAEEWFGLSEQQYEAKGLSRYYLAVVLWRVVFKSLDKLSTKSIKET